MGKGKGKIKGRKGRRKRKHYGKWEEERPGCRGWEAGRKGKRKKKKKKKDENVKREL